MELFNVSYGTEQLCFPPGLLSPFQPESIIAPWPVPNYTAWWQRHMNNLPRAVTRRCINSLTPTVKITNELKLKPVVICVSKCLLCPNSKPWTDMLCENDSWRCCCHIRPLFISEEDFLWLISVFVCLHGASSCQSSPTMRGYATKLTDVSLDHA